MRTCHAVIYVMAWVVEGFGIIVFWRVEKREKGRREIKPRGRGGGGGKGRGDGEVVFLPVVVRSGFPCAPPVQRGSAKATRVDFFHAKIMKFLFCLISAKEAGDGVSLLYDTYVLVIFSALTFFSFLFSFFRLYF